MIALTSSLSLMLNKREGRRMKEEVFVWLGLFILFLIIEIATVGLTTIWLAGGAFVALILSLADLNLWLQIIVFFVVSFILILFTRPFAMKYINFHHEKTNYEGIIGKVVKITKKVDNLEETGTAIVNGMEWMARTKKDDVILNPGDLAKVIDISGVKLIVEKYEEE